MPRSTYYYYLKNLEKEDKYAQIKEEIKTIYHQHKGRYGYRRITLALRRKGYKINHKTVFRLMKTLGLKSIVRPKRYKSYRGEVGKIAPNIIQRNFKANAPNEKWATDITEISVGGEKIFLSPMLDMYNGEIISYSISRSPVMKQVLDMLEEAFDRIEDGTNLIIHSDQGWQYQNKRYQEKLKSRGITQSMSRKGNCLDNAITENFFSTLKSELIYIKKFSTIEELVSELHEYIRYYNNERIKEKLKGLSPVEFRTQSCKIA